MNSQAGAYFVTICAYDHRCVFGRVNGRRMVLSSLGNLVKEEWLFTEKIRSNMTVDKFVIMPNHLHGIVIVKEDGAICRGVSQYAPTNAKTFRSPSNTVGAMVRGFKGKTTKKINQLRRTPGKPVWQRNYYEHVIRNEQDLYRIRQYIINNPAQWEIDQNNPGNFLKAQPGRVLYAGVAC